MVVGPLHNLESNRDGHSTCRIKQLKAGKVEEKAASGFTACKRSKKANLDQMDRMDMQYNENMSKLYANVDKLTNSISGGFALLRGLLYTPSTANVRPSSTADVPPPIATNASSTAANVQYCSCRLLPPLAYPSLGMALVDPPAKALG